MMKKSDSRSRFFNKQTPGGTPYYADTPNDSTITDGAKKVSEFYREYQKVVNTRSESIFLPAALEKLGFLDFSVEDPKLQ